MITDLHAEAEPIPLQLTREDWFGHKVSNLFNSFQRTIEPDINCTSGSFSSILLVSRNKCIDYLLSYFFLKGMVQTASYIRNKLEKENLLGKAFAHNPERGTPDFRLVLVGHSLGAGTAAILALLLRHEYPHVHCYAYSPPGGLLR